MYGLVEKDGFHILPTDPFTQRHTTLLIIGGNKYYRKGCSKWTLRWECSYNKTKDSSEPRCPSEILKTDVNMDYFIFGKKISDEQYSRHVKRVENDVHSHPPTWDKRKLAK